MISILVKKRFLIFQKKKIFFQKLNGSRKYSNALK